MDWKNLMWSFQGRIGRQQWWLAHVAQLIVLIVVGTIIAIAFGLFNQTDQQSGPPLIAILLLILIYIPWIWSSLALNAKRWHDRDKSAWWMLIGLIPLIGIWALIENGFLRGGDGPNRFGEDPLGG